MLYSINKGIPDLRALPAVMRDLTALMRALPAVMRALQILMRALTALMSALTALMRNSIKMGLSLSMRALQGGLYIKDSTNIKEALTPMRFYQT